MTEMRVSVAGPGDSMRIHVDSFDENNKAFTFPIEIEVQGQDKPRLLGVRVMGKPVLLRTANSVLSRDELQPPAVPDVEFWLVWARHSGQTSHHHESQSLAKLEAERLARANPGKAFYVLPATEYAVADIAPVAWRSGEEVPF